MIHLPIPPIRPTVTEKESRHPNYLERSSNLPNSSKQTHKIPRIQNIFKYHFLGFSDWHLENLSLILSKSKSRRQDKTGINAM